MTRRIQWQSIAVIALVILNFAPASSQTFQAGADTVLKLTPGEGNSHGQNSPFFPKNVFGLPSTFGSDFSGEAREEEICSLNFGGEIIIGFKNAIIVDKNGPDFTIFENAFKSPFPPYIFAEPAKVAVSRDGITFKEFPYDSLTLKGCAGMTQTNGKKNPLDPAESGGDQFDLADIGMDSVRFVKITDITNFLTPGHPFYQAALTGFDLDAVVGLHLAAITNEKLQIRISIFTHNSEIIINAQNFPWEGKCEVYSLDGRSVVNESFSTMLKIPFKNLPKGAYIAVVKIGEEKFTQKILVE